MSRNLSKTSASLLLASLLLCLSPLPAQAGGCGAGGMGYVCQPPQRSMWDRAKGMLYNLLPWAPMETASDLVSQGYNAYLKNAWGLQPYGFAEKALAGSGTFLIEAGMAGPGELANAARGLGRLGVQGLANAAKAVAAASTETIVLRNAFTGAARTVGMGEAGAVILARVSPASVPVGRPSTGFFGGAASRVAEVNAKSLSRNAAQRRAMKEAGRSAGFDLPGATGQGVFSDSVMITWETARRNEQVFLNQVVEAAKLGADAAKAGAGFSSVFAYVHPETGALQAIGGSVAPPGTRQVLFRFFSMMTVKEGKRFYTSGFHKLIANEVDPIVAGHLEDLARKLYPQAEQPMLSIVPGGRAW